MRHARGLSLVEVLAAMAVLVIGVTAVTLMLLQGTKFTRAAIERNAAAMILAEAVPEIERRHLITSQMLLNDGLTYFTPPPQHVGLFIETTTNTQPTPDEPGVPSTGLTLPDIHDDDYTELSISTPKVAGQNTAFHGEAFLLKCFSGLTADQIHMSAWPMPPVEPPRLYGSLEDSLKRAGDQSPHGAPLRVLYRLERHQNWQEHYINAGSGTMDYPSIEDATSSFRGVYVLTMTIYRDARHDASALEQVSDPYVVYLYDRKVRVAP